jgi:hypothetical protein
MYATSRVTLDGVDDGQGKEIELPKSHMSWSTSNSHCRLISSTHCRSDGNTAAGRSTGQVQELAILTNSILLMTCPQHPPLCAERVPLSELRMFGGLVVERRERKRRRKKREDMFFIVDVRFSVSSYPLDLLPTRWNHCR